MDFWPKLVIDITQIRRVNLQLLTKLYGTKAKKAYLRGIILIERALIVEKTFVKTFATIVVSVCKAAMPTQEKKTFANLRLGIFCTFSNNDNLAM